MNDILKKHREENLKENKEGLKYFRKWVNGEKLTPNQIHKVELLITAFEAEQNFKNL